MASDHMSNRYAFTASISPTPDGDWQIASIAAVTGKSLPSATALHVAPVAGIGSAPQAQSSAPWQLFGLISNIRYANRTEVLALRERQEGLGRAPARWATLIPIKKSAAWWALAQDERRAIFEEASHHTAIGLDYLPAVARQLYHCRDLGEPFDFLTWFEYRPADAGAFDELLGRLRETAEWEYVEREVEVRLERAGSAS